MCKIHLSFCYIIMKLFDAPGWVVGSLEILGSPGGLAQALGSGLRDFVSLPFQGLLQGPWGFIVGITHGSASLMKHVTAGIEIIIFFFHYSESRRLKIYIILRLKDIYNQLFCFLFHRYREFRNKISV